jgi:hypothetical protein
MYSIFLNKVFTSILEKANKIVISFFQIISQYLFKLFNNKLVELSLILSLISFIQLNEICTLKLCFLKNSVFSSLINKKFVAIVYIIFFPIFLQILFE